jgi:hypothetical protein
MATIEQKMVTTYRCEKCGAGYATEESALKCESREILYNKGVKVGDTVLLTSGAGSGEKAKVTRVYVIDKEWGHYAWEKYWHTVALEVDLINSYGSRGVTFDSYQTI